MKSWRIVTTASRLTTPIMITAASISRDVTKPRAIDPFCRFTTGYSATALPTAVSAFTASRRQPHSTRVSEPALVT